MIEQRTYMNQVPKLMSVSLILILKFMVPSVHAEGTNEPAAPAAPEATAGKPASAATAVPSTTPAESPLAAAPAAPAENPVAIGLPNFKFSSPVHDDLILMSSPDHRVFRIRAKLGKEELGRLDSDKPPLLAIDLFVEKSTREIKKFGSHDSSGTIFFDVTIESDEIQFRRVREDAQLAALRNFYQMAVSAQSDWTSVREYLNGATDLKIQETNKRVLNVLGLGASLEVAKADVPDEMTNSPSHSSDRKEFLNMLNEDADTLKPEASKTITAEAEPRPVPAKSKAQKTN